MLHSRSKKWPYFITQKHEPCEDKRKWYFGIIKIFNVATVNQENFTWVVIIWKIWNELSAHFINFVWNDHKFKSLYIIWPLKMGFTIFKMYFHKKMHWWHGHCQLRFKYVPKYYYTWDHMIFDTTLSTD